MSGMEKFQTNETWRTNFKKFLFMERKPALLQQTTTINETQRYSLDIGEDLKNILEQKKIQKTVKFNLGENHFVNNQNNTSEGKPQNPTISTAEKIEGEEKMNRSVFSYDDTRYEDQEQQDLAMWQKTSDESFEALEKMCEKTASDPNSTLFKHLQGGDDETDQNIQNIIVWQKTSDESFEALEKMCDKTASDPDSTLFQYLHSDHGDRVLADVKKRSADGNMVHGHERDPLLMKLSNCTLLDEVEEPSRMWENTICCETVLQTSPVKMVGLLRPSTIIEEAPDDSSNSDVSSQMSFQTATKEATSDVSSSVYDTAHDSTVASTRTDFSSRREQQLEVIDVDQIVFSALAKANNINEETPVIPSIEIIETDISNLIPSSDIKFNDNISANDENDVSMNLIDLEKTFGPLHNSPHSSILDITIADGETVDNDNDNENKEPSELEEQENEMVSYNILDESIIEILSDEDDTEEADTNEQNQDNNQDIEVKSEETSITSISINQDTYSFNESFEENKENFDKIKESSNKPMQFNDTLEEVEYMLKKGMEYMAAEAATKQMPPQVKPTNETFEKISRTQPNSPMTKTLPTSHISASASKVKPVYNTPAKKTPATKYNGSSSKKRFEGDITKPFPKLDIFNKPPIHARHKELSSKQQKFSHIVSPIGTYMKKTATTPLMSSIRSRNKNADLFNSTAFRELENESRLYHPKFETDSNRTETSGLSKLPGLSGAQKTLPKKAYISSELKHIVDERTPVTIPGGKKIQKYLENAMMPAVLRHDGKFKIPGGIKNHGSSSSPSVVISKVPLKTYNSNSPAADATRSSHIPRRNNASLADLSLMSGDVSMYTIMDAQKF